MSVPISPSDKVTHQYADLLDHLEQAVIVTSAAGTILRWSAVAERLYGWSRDEAIGRPIVEVTPTDLSRERAAEIMSAISKGTLWSGTFPVRTRKGRTFDAAVTDVPILDDRGEVAEIIGISAPAKASTDLTATARDFARAASAVWPGRVVLDADRSFRAITGASEPHLVQLFSLLLIRLADSMNAGSIAQISVAPADRSPLLDFVLPPSEPLIYVGIGIQDRERAPSIIRTVRSGAQPTDFARTLVHLLNGRLLAGSAGRITDGMHFLIPLAVP